MTQPRVLVLRAPGTNCDQETGFAFEQAGGIVDFVHVNALIETPAKLRGYQVLCLPGGFSYGDDIAAGRILASQMHQGLGDVLYEFRVQEKLILGICNGFQVLIKSGLLIENDEKGLKTTLTWNEKGRFMDNWVNLKADDDRCVFLRGVEQMYLPIAHAEGKFVARSESILNHLSNNHQLALKYCRPDGSNGQVPFPHNPNGSMAHVAGVCDETGRIFGLMPHPERHIDGTQHPHWTRHGAAPRGEGMAIFDNAVAFFA